MRSSKAMVGDIDPGYFSDPSLLVLTSLAAGAKHGHAMLDDIEDICRVRLGPGTLYGAIARLEKKGWIEPLPPEDRRRPYRLTDAGRLAFAAKMKTMQRFVAVGKERVAIA